MKKIIIALLMFGMFGCSTPEQFVPEVFLPYDLADLPTLEEMIVQPNLAEYTCFMNGGTLAVLDINEAGDFITTGPGIDGDIHLQVDEGVRNEVLEFIYDYCPHRDDVESPERNPFCFVRVGNGQQYTISYEWIDNTFLAHPTTTNQVGIPICQTIP